MARPCVPEGDRALLGLGWGKLRGHDVLALPAQMPRFFTFFRKYRPRYHKIDERHRESLCKSPQITSRSFRDLQELSLLTVLG